MLLQRLSSLPGRRSRENELRLHTIHGGAGNLCWLVTWLSFYMQTRGGSGSFKEEVTVIEGLSFIHLFGISSKYIRYFKLISSRKPNQNTWWNSNLLTSLPHTSIYWQTLPSLQKFNIKKKKSSENCWFLSLVTWTGITKWTEESTV